MSVSAKYLASVKKDLRVSHVESDEEIIDLIEACRKELKISGITSSKIIDEEDTLIKRAVKTYCKANFGFENPDMEKLTESYELLKKHLCLSTEYITEV